MSNVATVRDTTSAVYEAQVDANELKPMKLDEAQWLFVTAQCLPKKVTWRERKADSVRRVADLRRINHLPDNAKVISTIVELPDEVTVWIETSEHLQILTGRQDKKQKIVSGAIGKWAWNLKAVKDGEATVRINVSTLKNDTILIREMKVSITMWQRIERFMTSTWPVLLAIGSAVGGAVTFVKRRKSKGPSGKPRRMSRRTRRVAGPVASTEGPPPQIEVKQRETSA
jgi:hypothetical protein